MELIKQLLGRLHPVIVHLPIGFIVCGLLLQWYDRKTKTFKRVISLVYLWGGISAALACITGYLQYLGAGYAFDSVKWHLWSGIATALFSFVMYAHLKDLKYFNFLGRFHTIVLPVIFFILISFTGHQGGTLTHGEDYLIEPLPNSLKSALGFETFEEKEIAITEENWENTLIYEDVIKPILNNNCVSCHNSKKKKGELLLNNKDGILKGGENGEVVIAENAAGSEVYIRMNLSIEDEDHMPPKGKTQPTKEEIKLVGAWIDAGHPFETSIKDAGLDKELFLSFFPKKYDADHPDIEVPEAIQDSISTIENTGVHVDPISKASNFLSVSCINKPAFSDTDFETLLPIAMQIAKLDLGRTQVSDSIFEKLARLQNLTILKLDHTRVSGKGIGALSSLEHLKSINFTATQFEGTYLNELSDFQKLEKVYLYNTKVRSTESSSSQNPRISIEFGEYDLPPIATDSIIY